MEKSNIRVLIVDDHALFRRGLTEIIAEQPDFELVGEAESGSKAIRMSQELEPDVILMDVHMPDGDGIEALGAIKESIAAHVLMLTVSDKDEDLLGAIVAGADGYLLKNADPDDLCRSIRQVVQGKGALSTEVTLSVMRAAATPPTSQVESKLSPREREVIQLLAEGATTSEIADTLVISANTVKTYISRILDKLDASNRTEAVARAAKLGLIKSGKS